MLWALETMLPYNRRLVNDLLEKIPGYENNNENNKFESPYPL